MCSECYVAANPPSDAHLTRGSTQPRLLTDAVVRVCIFVVIVFLITVHVRCKVLVRMWKQSKQ